MKKVLALGALGCMALGANAQSSVTIFGVMDAAVQRVSGEGNGHINREVASSNQSSRLGFRGVEDLGGGLNASFWLESQIANDSGASGGPPDNTNNQTTGVTGGGGFTFNRRSTVSLAGGFGELRLGRDLTPSYISMVLNDPFGNIGVGGNFNLLGAYGGSKAVQTTIRVSNGINYFLPPNLGGFYGQLTYALGENASNAPGGIADDGKYVGTRVGFTSGPFDTAAAWGRTTLVAGDYVQTNLVASWKFDFMTLMGGVYQEQVHAAATGKATSVNLAAAVPIGSGIVKLSWATTHQNAAAGHNNANLYAIGYQYNLSKRTAVYTTYSLIDNKGASVLYNQGRATTTPGGNATGFEVGLRTAF